jgi:hypothetical protein
MADVNSVAAELSNVALDAPARLPEEPESAALSQAATIFQGSISFQQMNLYVLINDRFVVSQLLFCHLLSLPF